MNDFEGRKLAFKEVFFRCESEERLDRRKREYTN